MKLIYCKFISTYTSNTKIMNNKINIYFLREFLSLFVIILFSIGIIIWVVQAVNYLEFVTEDGHSFLVYIKYSLLNLPKIISRLLPFAFFTTLFLKYYQNFTEYDQHHKLHVEHFQQRHFLRIKKATPNDAGDG